MIAPGLGFVVVELERAERRAAGGDESERRHIEKLLRPLPGWRVLLNFFSTFVWSFFTRVGATVRTL
jgi:hypothetical protein